jgi:hypothetical protein
MLKKPILKVELSKIITNTSTLKNVQFYKMGYM